MVSIFLRKTVERTPRVHQLPHPAKSHAHRISTALLAVLFACAAFIAPSQAATLTLKNGDRLSGNILRLSDATLSFTSPIFGDIEIPWSEVDTLISDSAVRVALQDGAIVDGSLNLQADGQASITPTAQVQPTRIARSDISALNPKPLDTSVRYTGRLDIGGAASRGNASDEQANLNAELIARRAHERLTLGLELNEARTSDEVSTSNRRLLTQYDRFINAQDFLFATAKAERDEIADLALRTAIGIGYGRQFIDTDTTQFSGQIGVSTVRERLLGGESTSYPTLTLGLKLERPLLRKDIVYFQQISVDSSLRHARDTLVRARLGLRIPIANSIHFSTQLNLDYDHEPAPGIKKTDTGLLFNVGYKF